MRQEALTFPPFEELTKLIFAEPKTGKTTWASQDPGAFFIATEPGHDFVKTGVFRAYRWGPDPQGVDKRPNFQDLVRALYEARSRGDLKKQGYKTAIIDIVDNLSAMCLDYVCQNKGIAYPPESDYGKTWKEIRVEWELWMKRLLDIVNVTFITHCAQDKVEITQENGIKKEIVRFVPTFKGNKMAQFLDGVVNCMGYLRTDDTGRRYITFRAEPTLGTGDRSKILEAVGPIWIPKDADGFKLVSDAYAAKAKELGINLKSKWEY